MPLCSSPCWCTSRWLPRGARRQRIGLIFSAALTWHSPLVCCWRLLAAAGQGAPDQKLEAAEGSFDAVVCTVSVQYLQQPERVFAEIYRVLRPGGVCIVSFSNRMFYQKAIASWRDSSGYGRIQLVRQYFQCVQGFTVAEVVKDIPEPGSEPKPKLPGPLQFLGNVLRLFQRSSQDPFYAVVAYRNFKPIHEQT
eukprot:jgi/Mesen1/6192/ME000032S05480